jgi:TLC domain
MAPIALFGSDSQEMRLSNGTTGSPTKRKRRRSVSMRISVALLGFMWLAIPTFHPRLVVHAFGFLSPTRGRSAARIGFSSTTPSRTLRAPIWSVPVGSNKKKMRLHSSNSNNNLFLMSQVLMPHACQSPSQGLAVAVTFGTLAATLQWFLATRVLSKQKKKSALPSSPSSYTAHSIVALALMLLLSVMGMHQWWSSSFASSIGNNNLLLHASPSARWMAAVVLGTFGAWDIPTSLRVSALRKPDVVTHHVVMMILAALGVVVLPMPYIFYYFGVAELSSIPLIAYDQVTYWIEQQQQQNHNNNHQESLSSSWNLTNLQQLLGVITSIAFTLVRVVSFSKVTFCNFLPDCRAALLLKATATAAVSIITPSQRYAISFLMVACTLFTLLQWFWFGQMIQTIRKQMVMTPSSSSS